jgi:predicted glutamine amidotransferase
MCRWMGWLGQELLMEEILFNSPHSIVDQSLNARMGAEPTNGDGFGLGWYGAGEGPGVYHSTEPAWSDPNLRELAAHVESPLFLAHVRAAIGSPVQQTNCHPFRHENWLFVHNGYIGGFDQLRRELMFAVSPEHFRHIHGSTDTEVVFALALTHGLTQDPLSAMERTVGDIEQRARAIGVEDAVQGTFGISDGETLWAVRYATSGTPRTLYTSADPTTVRRLYPDDTRLRRVSDDDRVVVSEPFSDLPGLWNEVPPSTMLTVRRGGVLEHAPFRPQAPEPVPAGLAGATPA